MVTRKDIAREAGVSVSVVSRALNNSGYVNAQKREKILKIAEKLGYFPNPKAMHLMKKKTKQILFYSKNMKNAYNTELYEGMCKAAEEQDYIVAVCGSLKFYNIRDIMADGLILSDAIVAERYLRNEGKNYFLPAVVATYDDPVTFTRSIPVVGCDLWEGMNMLLEYLVLHGHHRIAYVSPYVFEENGPRFLAWKSFMLSEAGDRLMDYFYGLTGQREKTDSQIPDGAEEGESEYSDYLEDDFFGEGARAADAFLKRKTDATAVVCFNDEMAYGFCKRLRELGKRIPRDVSVVGIDGSYVGRYVEQPLTTLSTDPFGHGRICVEILLSMINGREIRYRTKLPTRIIEGETVSHRRHGGGTGAD
ncbi:MAG: LacI family transcriptional regulator [Lachnospiraceae bacterium]|nr:LacI family transcriptional regulator [Lachnospiraceae bacterium]